MGSGTCQLPTQLRAGVDEGSAGRVRTRHLHHHLIAVGDAVTRDRFRFTRFLASRPPLSAKRARTPLCLVGKAEAQRTEGQQNRSVVLGHHNNQIDPVIAPSGSGHMGLRVAPPGPCPYPKRHHCCSLRSFQRLSSMPSPPYAIYILDSISSGIDILYIARRQVSNEWECSPSAYGACHGSIRKLLLRLNYAGFRVSHWPAALNCLHKAAPINGPCFQVLLSRSARCVIFKGKADRQGLSQAH